MPQKPAGTEELLELHGPLILKIIWNLIPSIDDAQDIFQETFLQHHLALSQGREIHNARAWLCVTARNAAFKCRRLEKRQPLAMDDEILHQHPAPKTNPDQSLIIQDIRDHVCGLPEKQAQVFSMRNFEHLSYAEIALNLDISEEAARASGYKGLKKMRSLMNGGQEDSHV